MGGVYGVWGGACGVGEEFMLCVGGAYGVCGRSLWCVWEELVVCG